MPFAAYNAVPGILIGGGSSHFTEGQVLWEFTGVDATPKDVNGDTGFYFRLIARQAPVETEVGGVHSHFSSTTEKAIWNLYSICNAGGVAPEKLDKLIAQVDTWEKHNAIARALSQALKTKQFCCQIADSDYKEGKQDLVLATLLPADTYVGRESPAPAKAARASRSAEPAAPATNGTTEATDEAQAPTEDDTAKMEADFEKMLEQAMK